MTRMVRWDPFRDLAEMRGTVDRLFYRGLRRPRIITWQAAERFLPVDVYETDDEVVVEASLPGLKPEEVAVSVIGDRLTIKAESKTEEANEEQNYYRKERRNRAFERALTLPVEVDADEAKATFENGELSLHLPKTAAEKPTTIEVKANGAETA